ncbi:MAG: flagellar biosynthesis anti-sigma factor FlgM [Deltaproteobacteria bacterium]|jgi:flagellar biosynthesis anti-sigma factor FlgM|nr:flagellar biosynthesis anti-sigma factor FlgM [Deltaproteobacteria bacterium]
MEIRNNTNRLDPYLNRVDLEASQATSQNVGQAGAQGSMKVNTGSFGLEGSDKVTLSSAALRDVVSAEAAKAPDIRQDKVDAIKASLASGSYAVDAQDIAGKLLGGAF